VGTFAPREEIGVFDRVVTIPNLARAAYCEVLVEDSSGGRSSGSSGRFLLVSFSSLMSVLECLYSCVHCGICNDRVIGNGGSQEGMSSRGGSNREQEIHAASVGEHQCIGVAIPRFRV